MGIVRRTFLISVYLLLALAIVSGWWLANIQLIGGDTGNTMVALSRLSALLGTYSILLQFVLISRAPWLEPAFGFDRLTRIHRYNGLAAFTLITAHIVLIIGGNAVLSGMSPPGQARSLIETLPFVWLAAAAYLLLLATIATSIVAIAKKLRYEVWYLIHFFNYAVILLAFWHQVANGMTLIGQDWLRYGWYGLHGLVLANLVVYRFLRPGWLWSKHRFRVAKVVAEGGSTRSIYVEGRRMGDFKYEAGQFNKWRFLQKGFWPEEHPFTISIEPNGKFLRLSPKNLGDYTSRMDGIKPGKRVIVSGPMGTFKLGKAENKSLLFIAGGIGITPFRAMMGAAAGSCDITLVYTAKTRDELVFKDELDSLAMQKGFKIIYVLSGEKAEGFIHGRIDSELLSGKVADIAEREVFLCGPPPMIESAAAILISLGVSKKAIHSERFSL